MNRILSSSIVLIVFVLCSTSAFAAITKGPYLLFEGANTSMSVLWQTTASETNTLRWGTDTSYSLGQTTVGVYGTAFQHKHTITGLQPDTKYFYEVVGYGSGSFRTAPAASATSVKILAYGDTRSTPANQEQVVARMRARYASDPAFQSIVLHSGDWINTDAETNWTSEWFVSGTTYPQIHAFQGESPIVGARGNHEGSGAVFKKYYPFPYVAGYYWSFDYGPAHITVVDQYTTFTAGSTQYNWIVSDLASTSKPWKILVLHEPGWGAGTHANNTNTQTHLHPLVLQHGVDLVINGHNHNYARAMVDGVPYITIGGGGASLYAVNTSAANIVKAVQTLNYGSIDIQNNSLLFTARNASDTVIDTVTVTHANQSPVANAGVDQTVSDSDGNGSQTVTLNGSGSSDPDGSIASWVWKDGATQIATGANPAVSLAVGVHTITLTVTDDQAATATDTVVITVNAAPNQSPVANAGVDLAVSDSDGNGSQSVTLNGSASSDADGSISSYIWKEGATQIATGATPAVSLAVGVHTITLTVADDKAATATDTVVVTVFPCPAVNAMTPGSCYQDIRTAYLAANSGDTIKAVSMEFIETLNANRPVNVTIQGGYDPTFTTVNGLSSLQRVNVSAGTLNTSGLVIK